MYTIYQITNVVNNKIYIGLTSKTIEARLKKHIEAAKYSLNTYFARAIRKYGPNNFIIQSIETDIPTRSIANEREQYYIQKYNSLDHSIGYNSAIGGEGGNTYINKTFEEMQHIKLKISHSNSGENNGKHTVIFMKDTNTNVETRFGSLSDCDRHLKTLGYSFIGRVYSGCALSNQKYGIQHRLFQRFIFRFENDEYYQWTDYPTKSGTFPYKITNMNTGEEFIGISKQECAEHFNIDKLYARIDPRRLLKNGYKLQRIITNEYKNSLE